LEKQFRYTLHLFNFGEITLGERFWFF